MIQSFSDDAAEAFYVSGKGPKTGWQKVASVVARKLDYLNAARQLGDLLAPPGNRLEELEGDRSGQDASASTINGAFASSGPMLGPSTWPLSIITSERVR